MKPNKLVIGVTGTIAAGKSTMCRYMEERYDALRIDADIVARGVVEDMKAELAEMFGAGIIGNDGHVDRKALGAIVFADPEKLVMLNKAVHPETSLRIKEMISQTEKQVVLVEAVELLRSDLKELIDTAWVVYAEEPLRVKRMMEVRGLTRQEAADRVRSQLDDETYRQMADTVIRSTDGPVEWLTDQCDAAMEALLPALKQK